MRIAVAMALSLAWAAYGETSRAAQYLAEVTDRNHETIDVYTDHDAAGNHFAARARMSSDDDRGRSDVASQRVPAMDEAWTNGPKRGATCIRAVLRAAPRSEVPNWGAWVFMNGVQEGSAPPKPNWGEVKNAGFDATGATRVSFWARGEKGGEVVEFFALGIGTDARKVTRVVTLDRQWREFSLELPELDLSSVLGGFGWSANVARNGWSDVVFYLDDIRYELAPAAARKRRAEPHFAVSYETRGNETFDRVMRNAAHTYDNALVLLAFLAAGDGGRARAIADAFVAAVRHDRDGGGGVRNAYQAGDLFAPPGWGKVRAVRLPGWSDESGRWIEDRYSVDRDAGNTAWVMIALLAYHLAAAGPADRTYLTTAEELGEWIERHCRRKGAAGYFGADAVPYRSTEHNLDLYAAFSRLFDITHDAKWSERASHARAFVLSVWDEPRGVFWTGMEGGAKNTATVPLDVQAWAVLALREPRRRALAYAEEHMRMPRGYDYSRRDCVDEASRCDDRRGVWYEGTAQMAVAYRAVGDATRVRELIALLHAAQLASGAMPASDRREGLPTGFRRDGYDIRYFALPHIGATAWLVFAETGVNPYWIGQRR